mgnify:CR=1 FL=1
MPQTLQDEQAPIDRAICDAMVSSTPDTWNVITLTLTRTISSDIGAFAHSLSSPEGLPPVAPDDSVFQATFELDKLFDRYGKRFSKAVYTVELFQDSWRYHAEFSYD